jgi:hypothetical protein
MERQWMHKGGNNNFAARQNKRWQQARKETHGLQSSFSSIIA